MPADPVQRAADTSSVDRRTAVLQSALETFARSGYRTTSMDTVARLADISRPGLYFLFSSKDDLLRAAVSEMLTADLHAITAILADDARPLPARLLSAFDRWAGRYVGSIERAVTDMIDEHAHLLGPIVVTAPRTFARRVTDAVAAGLPHVDRARARAITQTLISTSIGLKHQVTDRAVYRRRMRSAIELLLDSPD